MTSIHQVVEGRQEQSEEEALYYSLTTTPFGSTPSSVVVTVRDITNPTAPQDVTLLLTTGAPAVVGDVITLPKIHSVVKSRRYEVRVKFTDIGGNVFVAKAILVGVE